jgi:hypothetical protein
MSIHRSNDPVGAIRTTRRMVGPSSRASRPGGEESGMPVDRLGIWCFCLPDFNKGFDRCSLCSAPARFIQGVLSDQNPLMSMVELILQDGQDTNLCQQSPLFSLTASRRQFLASPWACVLGSAQALIVLSCHRQALSYAPLPATPDGPGRAPESARGMGLQASGTRPFITVSAPPPPPFRHPTPGPTPSAREGRDEQVRRVPRQISPDANEN